MDGVLSPLKHYLGDLGEPVEEDVVMHREDLGKALFHFKVEGWCEIAHVELGCKCSFFCL